jgi:dodecin
MATTIARVTEINATSDVSFDDAIKAGVARAHKTLRGVTGAWVKEQKVIVKEGVVKAYRVNLLVTFVLDD